MELEELYKEIQPRIYAFFFVKTSSKESAEDLTHEVFYEAIKGLPQFSHNSTIQTWLFSIAKNRLKKYYRSQKYKKDLETLYMNEEKVTNTPEEELLKKEEQRNIIQQINQLDDLAKEIVTLRVYGELSFKEIGILMEKSENYVRVTFHRAKLKMQKEMEGYHG
ncbi:MAG TPA: sigma-70 family RNA polymerase sigma factor [Paenibacillaceae bacterium]|nr:sigma-70 family RNA polymerase sigma factor [Paenibacillaceae bacterium]